MNSERSMLVFEFMVDVPCRVWALKSVHGKDTTKCVWAGYYKVCMVIITKFAWAGYHQSPY